MRKIWLSVSLIFIIMIGCGKYSKEELLAAPEQINIDGREYIMDALVWRNYQPIYGSDGPPLHAAIDVIAIDSLPIPDGLDADHIWVINGDDIWSTDLINRYIPYGREYMMEKLADGEGPDWEVGIYVDVVIEVFDEDDSTYLLRVDSQMIHRID